VSDGDRNSFVDLRQALIGGGIAAVIAGLGVGTTGVASGAEARALLESVLPTIRFLSSTVITASATILALMLTILNLSKGLDRQLTPAHYQRVRQISLLASVTIIAGTILLLFLSIPIGESEVLAGWYRPIYYGIVVTSSLVGGSQVAVVLMLLRSVDGLISIATGDESHLVEDGAGEGAAGDRTGEATGGRGAEAVRS
jgi:hypothetical protein